jgi:hypothetical protein
LPAAQKRIAKLEAALPVAFYDGWTSASKAARVCVGITKAKDAWEKSAARAVLEKK